MAAGLGLALVASQGVADDTSGALVKPSNSGPAAAVNDIALQHGEQAEPSTAVSTGANASSQSGAAPASSDPALSAPPPSLAKVAVASAGEVECLTAAVYYEARGESAEGQAAVAQVVLNRVGEAKFGKSICAVVYQGAHTHSCQFSFACGGPLHHPHEAAAWDRAHAVAQRALNGYVMTAVGRATSFHVASLGAVWGPHMAQVAHIGHHIFYAPGGRRELARAYKILQADAKLAAQSTTPTASPTVTPVQPVSTSVDTTAKAGASTTAKAS